MAKKQKKQEITINLIPEVGFAATITGRVLAWMLSSFRIIVIVTEIIVMIAFLSRFWLDARNTDLGEQILQKQAVIAASSDFEREFKFTQKRLAIFSELAKEEGVISGVVNTITTRLPADVVLTNITLTDNQVNVSGTTPNEKSIQQLMVNLGASDQVKGVKLLGISPNTKDPSLMTFKIEFSLNK